MIEVGDVVQEADNALVAVNQARMAMLVITLDGEMGELPDPIDYDTPDDDVRRIVVESVAGGLPGIDAQEVNLDDFVVRRLPAKDGLPDRIQVRPKTAFGLDY